MIRCGLKREEFITENISVELFSVAKQVVEAGVQVDVREYLSASSEDKHV